MEVKVYFDGSCDNNSKLKYMGIGVAVYLEGEYSEELSHSEMVGTNGTNNVAEYSAVKKALEILQELNEKGKLTSAVVYGDSQLVINQLNSLWRVRQPHLKPYFKDCKLLLLQLDNVPIKLVWIPREGNKIADKLSTKCVKNFISKF